VRAGLELVTAVAGLKMKSVLKTRVGIATGLVIVGDLRGDGMAQEHEVVGETPNLAARLQTLADPDTVVIAGTTRGLLGELFEYRALGEVSAKGFAAPVLVWQVTGASAVDSRFEALRAARTPLVGRDEEIDLLMRRWQQAKGGEGCVVLISGEPGIGKSRIAETLRERLAAAEEQHQLVRYQGSPERTASALHPVRAQLNHAARFRPEDNSVQRIVKLEDLLRRDFRDLSGVAPLFAALLAIPADGYYPPLGLTPAQQKAKTLEPSSVSSRGPRRVYRF
jgi:hypothetical protein